MTRRLSLILGDADEEKVGPFIQGDTSENAVLRRWAAAHGVGSVNSEAAALRLLLQAGVEALTEHVLDEGYAQFAQEYGSPTAREERRSARERYVSRTEAIR